VPITKHRGPHRGKHPARTLQTCDLCNTLIVPSTTDTSGAADPTGRHRPGPRTWRPHRGLNSACRTLLDGRPITGSYSRRLSIPHRADALQTTATANQPACGPNNLQPLLTSPSRVFWLLTCVHGQRAPKPPGNTAARRAKPPQRSLPLAQGPAGSKSEDRQGDRYRYSSPIGR